MAILKPLVLGIALLCATPAAADPLEADPVSRWRAEITEASARFGIPVAWIERVMRAESGGQTLLGGRPITSRAGAMGLMQVMPGTWAAMRAAHRLGDNPHDPRDNILAGTAYLRAMYDRFGYPGLFAAYNAGPGRYAAHLATGRPLAGQLSQELGLGFVETKAGQAIEGTYRRPIQVGTARYALIEKSRDFTLVPWRPVLERAIGKRVSGVMRDGGGISWTIGRSRGLGIE